MKGWLTVKCSDLSRQGIRHGRRDGSEPMVEPQAGAGFEPGFQSLRRQ
jgi:hypothetical protein